MHRQAKVAAWIALALVMILALAACGGDEPEPVSEPGDQPAGAETPPATPPPATVTAADEAAPGEASDRAATDAVMPDALATEDPAPENDAAADFNVYTPGLRARSGLTVVRSTQYASEGTGAFFAEIRNDTGELLRLIEGSLDLLDADNLRLGTIPLSFLLNDIPPGQSFYTGEVFPLPDGYADVAVLLDYQVAEAPSLDAFYDLPVTIDAQGPGEDLPYVVSGAIQNTSRRDLVFWAVTLVALDAEDQIIGLSYAVVTPGTANRVWPAGAAAPFEARFGALAGDASAVASVIALAAGYAPLD